MKEEFKRAKTAVKQTEKKQINLKQRPPWSYTLNTSFFVSQARASVSVHSAGKKHGHLSRVRERKTAYKVSARRRLVMETLQYGAAAAPSASRLQRMIPQRVF